MGIPYLLTSRGICEVRGVRIAKISSKKADDHEDESDTSTLVGGEDIDEKTKAVVKK